MNIRSLFKGKYFLVSLLGLIILVVTFYGLLNSHISTKIWGISASADPVGNLTDLRALLHGLKHGCLNTNVFVNYPFGAYTTLNPAFYTSVPHWPLIIIYSITANYILSYNLAVLIMFFLNFILSYVYFSKIMKDDFFSLLPSALLTFSPYMFLHSWAHLGLLLVFPFPAFFYYFSKIQTTGAWKSIILSSLFFSMGLYTSQYYAYFMMWIGLAIFIFKRNIISSIKFIFLTLIFSSISIYLAFFKNYNHLWQKVPGLGAFSNNDSYIQKFSAHPIDYIWPNIHNFAFGDFYGRVFHKVFPERLLYSDEFVVSIGIACFLLLLYIFIHLIFVFFNKTQNETIKTTFLKNKATILPLLLIMFFSFVLSLPNKLNYFGTTLYLPNELIRYVLPFRAYSRFGIVFLFAAVLFVAFFVKNFKHGKLLFFVVLIFSIFEAKPKTRLHPKHSLDYIDYLKTRNEKVIIRFLDQDYYGKRKADLESALADKYIFNRIKLIQGGYAKAALFSKYPKFHFGALGDMGAELLLVDGKLHVNELNKKYLSLLKYFPEANIEIYKIIPSQQQNIKKIFQNVLEQRKNKPCFIMEKEKVLILLQKFIHEITH